MVIAVLAAASIAAGSWVPARWASNDPKTLEIVTQTPVNCLLMEQGQWSRAFSSAAAGKGIAVLGVVRPGGDTAEVLRRAQTDELAGLVLEGDFEEAVASKIDTALTGAHKTAIHLPPRAAMRFDANAPVIGTAQGVWPGVRTGTKAAASGGPWIDTNAGFLRFARMATDAQVWIANQPPEKTVLPVERYLQAISDAEALGARWVITLDDEFNRRLLARDPKADAAWKRIGDHLRFFESHDDWRTMKPFGRLAILEDPDSGALLSGGVLDMIGVKHTPARPIPLRLLSEGRLKGITMAVNVDPEAVQPSQKEALRAFTRGGGTLLTAPPGWKFPSPRKDRITLEKAELDQIDSLWKDINGMIGYSNLGVRLFNVGGVLSSMLADRDGRHVVLQLTNYTSYPVESITVHMLGKYTQATLYTPESTPRHLDPYPTDDGTGIDIEQLTVSGALVIE